MAGYSLSLGEKQEHLLKLGILTTAAILCEFFFSIDFSLNFPIQFENAHAILSYFPLLYCFTAFATRLFSVLRFESVIHEFDPYFNYRTTRFLTEQGFYNFHNWFDDRAWYPLGRIIGGTIYPGKYCHSSFFSTQK